MKALGVAGFASRATVSVTLSSRNALPVYARVEVTFGAGLSPVAPIDVAAISGIDGGLSTFSTGQTVTVNRTGGGAELALSTAFLFSLDVVRNRKSAGGTGLFGVRLYTGDGQAIDTDDAIPELQIGVGALSRTLIAPLEDARTSFTTATFFVSFGVSASGVPNSTATAFLATFPDGFNVSGAFILESDFSFDGSFDTSVNETASTVTITRSREWRQHRQPPVG